MGEIHKPAEPVNKAEPPKPGESHDKPGVATDNNLSASHPFSMPSDKNGRFQALEIIRDASGQTKTVPLDLTKKLAAGDHDIEIVSPNGTVDGKHAKREFLLHVTDAAPKSKAPVPATFVFSGSALGNFDIKDFSKESAMSYVADRSGKPDVAVYPLPEKHLIGAGETQESYAWSAPQSLIDKKDQKFAGYDDRKYLDAISDLVPMITKADPTHKTWAAMAFSQGTAFLSEVVSSRPNLFPTVGLVGGALREGGQYNLQAGNAKNVMIVNLRKDAVTLPNAGDGGLYFKTLLAVRDTADLLGANSLLERINGLAAIHNEKAAPDAQLPFYLAQAKNWNAVHLSLTAVGPSAGKSGTDAPQGTRYTSGDRSVTSIDLPAPHAFPEPPVPGQPKARTNGGDYYAGFDTSKYFFELQQQANADDVKT